MTPLEEAFATNPSGVIGLLIASSILFATVVGFLFPNYTSEDDNTMAGLVGGPYPNQSYDPISAKAYFDTKPFQVIRRSLQIASTSLGFALSLVKDKLRYV